MPEDIEYFLGCFKVAKDNGLEYEFMMSFLQDLGLPEEKITGACNYALTEWDM